MSQTPVTRTIFGTAVLVTLALALPATTPARLRADEGGAATTRLAKDLVGTWVLVGTPDKVEKEPEAGARLKFRSEKLWSITQCDPNSGEVLFHHGGTYTLDGDEYVETVKYANPNTSQLINQKLTFKVKVEGDTYTQTGVGNPYNEVWKRVK